MKDKIIQIIPAINYWLRCEKLNTKTNKYDIYYLPVCCFALVEYGALSERKSEIISMVNVGHTIDDSSDIPCADEVVYSIEQPQDLWHDQEGNLIV